MQDHPADTPDEPGGTERAPGQGDLASRLHLAAIGSLQQHHYAYAFARQQAAGRALPLWNWAAALCPPGWMAFRGLWRWLALWLLALVVLAAGLVALHSRAAVPVAVLAGLALALWLAGAALPGLWGDALVYRQAQRRIQAAVAAAPTMQEAMVLLGRQAPTRGRAHAVAMLCVLGLAALPLAWWSLRADLGERAAGPHAEVVTGPVHTAQPQPQSQAPAQPVAPTPAAPALPVRVPESDVAETRSLQAGTEAALAALATQAIAAPGRQQAAAAPADTAKGSAATQGGAKVMPRAAAPQARKLYVNVGIFADPANARRAHERLRQAGLPSGIDVVQRAGKTMQRVRVGPFASAAQANDAVAKVRLLGLEAVPAVQ